MYPVRAKILKKSAGSQLAERTSNGMRAEKKQNGGVSQHLASRCFASIRHKRVVTKLSAGFTIIELLVATAVFTLILMVAITGFFQIGQTFYRGVSATQTQTVARKIIDSLTTDIKFASTVTLKQSTSNPNIYYSCFGNVRYTYNLGQKVNLDSYDTTSKFGLLRDVPGACGNPYGAPAVPFNNPVELLANKMRLSKLVVIFAPSSPNLYTVTVKVAFGDDESLLDPNSANVSCNSNLATSRFCGVSELVTSVTKEY